MGCSCSSINDQIACETKPRKKKENNLRSQSNFYSEKDNFQINKNSSLFFDPTDKERIDDHAKKENQNDLLDDDFINLDNNFLESTFSDLHDFDPDSFNILYQGTSSLIIKAKKCGIPFAIKICKNIDDKSTEYQYILKKPIEEAEILHRCTDHRYIVKLYNYFISADKKRIYIIMEYCSRGTIENKPHFSSRSIYYSSNLFSMASPNASALSFFQDENHYLNQQCIQISSINFRENENENRDNTISHQKKQKKSTKMSHFSMNNSIPNNEIVKEQTDKCIYSEINITKAFVQILDAIDYLHANRIAHLDIKPSNILMDDKMNVKLADFGAAIFVPREKKENLIPVTFVGTFSYFPPEVFQDGYFDPFSADVWSLGVTLYQLSYGCLPFNGNNIDEKAREIREKEVEFPEFAEQKDPLLADLIRKMLNKDPKKRIKVSAIWNHPFVFKGMKISPKKSQYLSNFSTVKVKRRYFSS